MKKAGFNFHDYSAIDQVKKSCVPILFAQSGKDTIVLPHMTMERRSLHIEEASARVPEAGRGESITFAPEECHQVICAHFGEKEEEKIGVSMNSP